jgi:hypothetical protein
VKLKGRQLEPYLAAGTPHEVWSLTVDDIDHLDCERLVDSFPKIRRLVLHGRLGRLDNAIRLNDLSSMTTLAISNLFGMTSKDCLLPSSTPELEWLALHSIPRDYGAAMRSVWAKEVARGCLADFSALRAPAWLAENLDNPLRDWDGREHISAANFRKAVAQYKATRRAVLEAMSQSSGQELRARMAAVGREYGEAFNTLARRDDFIETVERDELFEALVTIPRSAQVADSEAQQLADWLAEGLEQVREW